MTRLKSAPNHLRGDHPDLRCRRLLFRSWHRGTQESDLILGSFAERFLQGFDSRQLDRFEALLDCNDADLFGWIIEGATPPPQYNNEIMHLLRNFCARLSGVPEYDRH